MENYDIAIIGGGVGGLFTAYTLSLYTDLKIALFEKGFPYGERIARSKSDLPLNLCGMGGAGTLGGGKLCGIPASGGIWKKTWPMMAGWETFINHLPLDKRASDTLVRTRGFMLSKNAHCEEIVCKSYPSALLLMPQMHDLIDYFMRSLVTNNVEIYTNSELTGIAKHKGKFTLRFSENGLSRTVVANKIIVATGRSGAGKIDILLSHLSVFSKAASPDLGIRIEFPRLQSQAFSSIGEDVKLKMSIGGIDLRTFCTCSGGELTRIELGKQVYYDGHFSDITTDYVNVGLMSRDRKLKGISTALSYCSAFEREAKDLTLCDFIKYGRHLIQHKFCTKFGDSIDAIVQFAQILHRKGYLAGTLSSYQVALPAIDGYNPVFATSIDFESSCADLYIIGDAAGISRGYVQSLWSSWCCASSIARQACGLNLNQMDLLSHAV